MTKCLEAEITKEEYWDAVADRVIFPGGKITDNFDKRRKLLSFLTRYDFHKKKVLEVGCGLSILSMALMMVNGGMECFATDVSQRFVDWTNTVSNGKIQAVKAAANALPHEDNTFDALFLFDVLEHVKPDEREKSYQELNRVLKEDSMIFINNPLTRSLHEIHDYGFFDKDLMRFVEIYGGRVLRSEIFTLNGYVYQFWVLGKGAVKI